MKHSLFGIVDLCGFKNDRFYMGDTLQIEEPIPIRFVAGSSGSFQTETSRFGACSIAVVVATLPAQQIKQ